MRDRKSETVSEKPKRGRPRKVVHQVFDGLPMIHDEITTERGRQNINYRQIGIEVLNTDQDAFRIVAGITGQEMHAGKTPAKGWQGLFQEIGRCVESRGFDDDFKAEVIRFLKSQRGKRPSEIRRSLRHWRLDRPTDLSAEDVATKVLNLIDGIRREYPSTSLETIREALGDCQVVVADVINRTV